MGLFSKFRAARQKRIEARQEGRTQRAQLRSDTRKAAYQAGVNPNSFISDTVGKVANVAQSVIGAKTGNLGGGAVSMSGGSAQSKGMGDKVAKPIWIIGAIAVGLFLMMKKK